MAPVATTELRDALLDLDSETFEVCDLVDLAGEMPAMCSSSCSTSGTCSCSTSGTCSCSTSTSAG